MMEIGEVRLLLVPRKFPYSPEKCVKESEDFFRLLDVCLLEAGKYCGLALHASVCEERMSDGLIYRFELCMVGSQRRFQRREVALVGSHASFTKVQPIGIVRAVDA